MGDASHRWRELFASSPRKKKKVYMLKNIRLFILPIIFQVCFFITQIFIDKIIRIIFSLNYSLGMNRWNDWTFGYQSADNYLDSFWGIVTIDFFSLLFAIFISLSILDSDKKMTGWKILLVYRLSTKALFVVTTLFLTNQILFSTLAFGLIFIIFDLIPFLIYKRKENI